MLPTLVTVFFLLAVTGSQVQSSDTAELALFYPNCSLTCMTELIPESSCSTASGLNQTCLCTNAVLNQQITLCASETCTIRELLTTQNASTTACGAELRDHSADMTIIALSTGGLALVIFIVRIVARLTTYQKTLFWDDWTLLLMVVITIPPTVLAPFLASNGLGRDIWTLPFDNINNVLLYFFTGELCYLVGLAINKISILCFFLRIFPSKVLRQYIYITMGICVAYGISFFFATLFQCYPINYMWHQWDDQYNGSCNHFHLQGWLAGGFNIVLDLVVIALPLGELSRMNLSKRKKSAVMFMFLIGIFTTVVSAVRLKYLVQFRHTQNPTYDYLAPGYWSVVELHVGIICASMPAINTLIKAYWPKLVSGTTLGGTKESGTPHSASNDIHYMRSARLKEPRSDDFEMLGDIEVDTAKLIMQSGRATVVPGTAK